MTQFQINEYVWDRLRDGPGIVVGINEELELPYSVAEITPDGKKLGRVGYRKDEKLCRYVKLIVPEDEAIRALDLLDTGSGIGLDDRLYERIEQALKQRGVEIE